MCLISTIPSVLQAVNELLESLGAPLEIVDGFVSSIAVTIPWQALLTDHCTLEVSGLQITCRPKYRTSKFSEKESPLSNHSLSCLFASGSLDSLHHSEYAFSPRLYLRFLTKYMVLYRSFCIFLCLLKGDRIKLSWK